MNYLNLEPDMLNADPFSDASPKELGVWLRVLGYCIKQENNGHLAGAKDWPARKWMANCGVDKRDVDGCKLLFVRNEADLIVVGYPVEAEHKRKAQSEGGKKGAAARWDKYKAISQPNGLPIGQPNGSENAVKEGKEREGKGEGSEPIPTDEAFQILTHQIELRGLSREQWAKIRQSYAGHPKFPAFGWVEWAKKTADAAVVFGNIELPGPWVSKRLGEALDGGFGTEKKSAAAPVMLGPPAGEM